MRAQPIVSAEMLAAGRAAFLRQRRELDDLHHFFDADLEQFLRVIYAAMDRRRQDGFSRS